MKKVLLIISSVLLLTGCSYDTLTQNEINEGTKLCEAHSGLENIGTTMIYAQAKSKIKVHCLDGVIIEKRVERWPQK